MIQFDPKTFPNKPGVYIFKDTEDKIIYIGKAKSLKKRISQYFMQKHENSIKTRFLVSKIEKIDYIIVDNEVEALLLENKLIKKHKPKYNINLKDDKTYPYIKITDEEFPKIMQTRVVKEDGEYYGPFTDGNARSEVYYLLVSIFKLLTPKTFKSKSKLNYEIGLAPAKSEKEIDKKSYEENIELAKQFLNGNVKPTVKKLKNEMINASNNRQYEYALDLKNKLIAIENFIEKQKVDQIKKFDQDIIVCGPHLDKLKFVVLSIVKGTILGKKQYIIEKEENSFENFLKAFYQNHPVPREIIVEENLTTEKEVLEKYLSTLKLSKVEITQPKKGDKLKLLELAKQNLSIELDETSILKEIQEKFHLPKYPKIIEFFDMSNLGKGYQVGALTYWEDGKRIAKNSRKFQIKSFTGKNDDFGAMREVLFRRYKRLKEMGDKRIEIGDEAENRKVSNLHSLNSNPENLPNLIILDGGKGQLSAGLDALRVLRLEIPILALAKKEEEIFSIDKHFKFDKNSPMMLLIRRMRDTTHNYVIAYNRKKRNIELRNSN